MTQVLTVNKKHSSAAVANRKNFAAKQNGMSMLLLLVVISVVSFFGIFAFKVLPNYMEYLTVKSIGNDIATDAELLKKPKSRVMKAIGQAFRSNSLYELKPEESFVLTKDGAKGFLVEINYEKRATLFSNLDIVTRFNHTYDDI